MHPVVVITLRNTSITSDRLSGMNAPLAIASRGAGTTIRDASYIDKQD